MSRTTVARAGGSAGGDGTGGDGRTTLWAVVLGIVYLFLSALVPLEVREPPAGATACAPDGRQPPELQVACDAGALAAIESVEAAVAPGTALSLEAP